VGQFGSGQIASFNPENGKLTPTGIVVAIPSPVCLKFL